MLSQVAFMSAQDFIHNHARPVEQKLFALLFEKQPSDDFIKALAEYRNADGGFGHGLEPDFWTPASSCYATTVAFQYLDAANMPLDHDFYSSGIQYLVETYDADYQGWELVTAATNSAPHAQWHDYDPTFKEEYFDKH